MGNESDSEKSAVDANGLPGILKSVKLDFATIRTVILTVAVVLSLLCVPFFFILRNFVTFDALDNYFKVTASVSPKILHTISEEVGSGYTKNLIFSSTNTDNTLLFYANKSDRVVMSIDVTAVYGPQQNVSLTLNGCAISSEQETPLHIFNYDLSKDLEKCTPNEPSLQLLKVVIPDGLKKGSTLQAQAIVLVFQRVHAHLEEKK